MILKTLKLKLLTYKQDKKSCPVDKHKNNL